MQDLTGPRPGAELDDAEEQHAIDEAYERAYLSGMEASWDPEGRPRETRGGPPAREPTEEEREARKRDEIDAAWYAHKLANGQIANAAKRKAQIALRKEAQSEAQNHRCCYCGCRFSEDPGSQKFATWEHVLPKSRGGADTRFNTVLACEECNARRGNNLWEVHFECMRTMGREYFTRPWPTD